MSDRIEEIKARCDAATPGPWVIVVLGNTVKSLQVISHSVCAKICSGISPKKKDADFIAHARDDIPFLLGEIERLTAERDAAITCQENEFVKQRAGMTALETLNWYRNLYHAENDGTERRIMAEAINAIFGAVPLPCGGCQPVCEHRREPEGR